MTKLSKIALLGSALLFGAVACQREALEENPNFDKEKNEVLTDFVLNIATTPDTKQTADVVQQPEGTTSAAFRGIDHALLLSYAKSGENGSILKLDETAGKKHVMDVAASAGYFGAGESRRVYEMALPLNSNILLFYGKAIKPDLNPASTAEAAVANRNNKSQYGSISYNVSETVNSARFTLERRMKPETDSTAFYTIERLIAGIGTLIMNTSISEDITAAGVPATDVAPYGFAITAAEYGGADGKIYWKEYDRSSKTSPVEPGNTEWYPLEKKLGEAYHRMIDINSAGGELRAGSGEAIGRTMTDLWTVINEVRCAEPMNKYEAVAKCLAGAISDELGEFFTAVIPTTPAPVSGVSVKTITQIKSKFTSSEQIAKRPTGGSYPTWLWPTLAQISAVESYDLAKFPAEFGLPRGATHYAWNKNNEYFYYPYYFNTSGMGGVTTNGDFSAISYYYPAELMYFGNSPIRTASTDKKVSDYPQGSGTTTGEWMAEASWTGWTPNTAVSSSTRAVAMTYNVNYGTALMQTQVKYDSGVLEDNNHHVQALYNGVADDSPLVANEKNQEITVTSTSFKLTGIIIGGIPTDAGWDYLPIKSQMDTPTDATDDAYITGFVYDNALSTDQQTIPVTGLSKEVYTLVLDNFLHDTTPFDASGYHKAATTGQSKVYVALEFQNNCGKDIYGNFNMIRNGGYFYLIGELDPGSNTVGWPDPTTGPAYRYPPYDSAGNSQEITRVFIQDYLTKATFKLGKYSLQHAYLTVPDLRAGSMSLGLSVDLSWQNGLVFESYLGDNNNTPIWQN